MKTNTQNTNTVTTNNAQFEQLLLSYELAYYNGDYEKELVALATAVTHSVLKKCINVSYNNALVEVKRDVARDTNVLNSIDRLNKDTYSLSYNKDGDLIRETTNKDNERALNTLTRESLGDGLDLVNVAVIEIMEQTKNHGADLEQTYTKRELSRKVWIKSEDSAKGWKDVETSGIKEVYKAVRREIEKSRAVQTNATNGYCYLEDVAKDEESGEELTIYRRLDKYADLGGNAVDFNGRPTLYSASEQTAKDMDELVASLNLTERQTQILKLRLRGYGYKAIATYLGVTQRAIAKTCEAIQKKVISTTSEDNTLFTLETVSKYTKQEK